MSFCETIFALDAKTQLKKNKEYEIDKNIKYEWNILITLVPGNRFCSQWMHE